jgi:hypothetical protein
MKTAMTTSWQNILNFIHRTSLFFDDVSVNYDVSSSISSLDTGIV